MQKPLYQLNMMEIETRVFALQVVSQDVHLEKAVEIFQIHPNEITPEMRRAAKTINYTQLYSQKPNSL